MEIRGNGAQFRRFDAGQRKLAALYGHIRAGSEDVVVDHIYANNQATCDIVFAGDETKNKHPLTREAPFHFIKRYSGDSAAQKIDAAREAELTEVAWRATGRTAMPLGRDGNEIRLEYLTGLPFGKIRTVPAFWSPDDLPDKYVAMKPELRSYLSHLAGAVGVMNKLHEAGLIHGDPHMGNFMLHEGVVHVIDFGLSDIIPRGTERFARARKHDLLQLCAEADISSRMLGEPLAEPLKSLVEEIRPLETLGVIKPAPQDGLSLPGRDAVTSQGCRRGFRR